MKKITYQEYDALSILYLAQYDSKLYRKIEVEFCIPNEYFLT